MSKLLLILLFPAITYSQIFQISSIPTDEYTIDHFTGDIYIKELWTGEIWKTNLKTMQEEKTEFPTLPVFANTTHKAVYFNYNDKNVYLYDFERHSSTILLENPVTFWTTKSQNFFSRNDKRIVIGGVIYDFENAYIMDKYGFLLDAYTDGHIEWIGDLGVIAQHYQYSIVECQLNTGEIDTLIQSDDKNVIRGFTYNTDENQLFYGIRYYWDSNSQVHLFGMNLNTDHVLYDYKRDENGGSGIKFETFRLSRNKKQICFEGEFEVISSSLLYLYHLDSNKVYKLTDLSTSSGRKDLLDWYDDETIVYINYSNSTLNAFKLPKNITEIHLEGIELFESVISNHPNPFNNSTKMKVKISEPMEGELCIYDVMGKLVKQFKLNESYDREYHLFWDGSDEHSRKVSSGIYFARIISQKTKYRSLIHKMLIIK